MESVFEGSRSAGSRDFMKKNTKGVTPAGDTRDYTLPREKLDLINVVLATIPGSVVLVLSFFFPLSFSPERLVDVDSGKSRRRRSLASTSRSSLTVRNQHFCAPHTPDVCNALFLVIFKNYLLN